MSRNPVGLAFTSLLAIARFACASSSDDTFSSEVGKMSIVFPQNDTFLSYNSELSWSIQCAHGSLHGADTINGYKYAGVPSGEH
ncbi:hypothetical protein MY3296_009665 [Beauveria thailandica]